MGNSQVFRINSPQVAYETIDGEVVIANLDKGYYYSLLKTGAAVWSGIERQLDRHSIIQEMTAAYEGSTAEIAAAVDEFLENLELEGIIVAGASLDSSKTTSNAPPMVETSNKSPFEKPILEKFTDMEDLLLLDPIHEVDLEAGWPNAKAT